MSKLGKRLGNMLVKMTIVIMEVRIWCIGEDGDDTRDRRRRTRRRRRRKRPACTILPGSLLKVSFVCNARSSSSPL